MEYKKGLTFMLIAMNLILIIYLVYSEINQKNFCIFGKGCDAVRNSEYSKIFGISITYYGLIAFLFLFLIYYLVHKNRLKHDYFLYLSGLGALFALFFLYLQFFKIGAICSNCLVVDTIAILIFIIAILTHKELRRK